MKIKSEYNSPKQGFFMPFLQVINNNFMTIAVASVIIIAILAISKTKEPPMEYNCSELSSEGRLLLKTTIDERLGLIKESMNSALNSDNGFIRDDMKDTIEKIMYDTRKEFCSPVSK